MSHAGFKPAILANDRPQILALEHSATGIGRIRSPDRPAHIKPLYRLSYPGPFILVVFVQYDVFYEYVQFKLNVIQWLV